LNHLDNDAAREIMEGMAIPIRKDQSVTFYHLYQNYLWLSPNPEDSIEARWGLRKCDIIVSQLRSAHNSMDFIERTYRIQDPKYADFAIRQQLEITRKLIEEWAKSECRVSSFPPPKKERPIFF
jgi:hypothetical protein